MTTEPAMPDADRTAAWDRPWLFLLAGLATTAIAAAWNLFSVSERGIGIWLLLSLGLLAGAWALTVRWPTPQLMLTAALLPLVGAQAVEPSWDSVRLVFYVGVVVAILGAGLLALSPSSQRLVLSLLVTLHFGGIIAVTFTHPPADAEPSWIASQLEARFYRPYLEFVYMTCTYRFYSPEAPPETLLWAQLTYADGERRWIKLPDPDSRGSLIDVRMLQIAPMVRIDPGAEVTEELLASRRRAGKKFDPPMPEPGDDLTQEYQPLTPDGKVLLASIVRHLAHANPHPSDPAQAITGIKVYAVVHRLLTQQEFAAGFEADDPTTYLAYYQGDFLPDGELKPSSAEVIRLPGRKVEVRPDPLLYWLIPAVYQEDGSVTDYVQLHAAKD
ncbi:MAG: hypothetical protein HYX68_10255 [Planctomycetes bacterium]|nr:hypothetical protein [Planctomycetota bacterium]